MATKTANLYARIEPETKTLAEGILDTLGIPVSTAINMFYKQIILNNGLPFEAKIPEKKILSVNEMTKDQFVAELEKGLQCIENGDVMSVEEAFSSLKKV